MPKQENWDANHPSHTENANRISNFTNRVLGNKFKGIENDVGRVFSLYNFIVKHRNLPANELREKITDNGNPIFSKDDIESIQKTVQSQVNTPYVKRLLAQSGGVHPVPVNVADPSRSMFWDRMIRNIMHPIAKRIPPSWDGLLWYTFILHSLEQNTLFGPFLSTALDTITLSLPVLSDLVSDVSSQILSLVPIPYAGKAGEILGYVLGLVFVIFAVFLNMSRKHFGSAFKVSLEAVPIIGDVLAEGSQMVETGAERYLLNRKRILKSVGTISPTTEQIVDYYSLSDEITEKPAPSLNPTIVLPAIKKEVIQYGLKTSGLGDTIDKIPNNLPTAEALEAAAHATPKKGGSRRKRCLRSKRRKTRKTL
jgi:hypothetical protein